MSGRSELNKYSNRKLSCPMVRHLWRLLQLQEFKHSLMSGHSSLTQDSPVNIIDSHLIVYLGSPVEPLFQNISCAQSYPPRSTYISSYGFIYHNIGLSRITLDSRVSVQFTHGMQFTAISILPIRESGDIITTNNMSLSPKEVKTPCFKLSVKHHQKKTRKVYMTHYFRFMQNGILLWQSYHPLVVLAHVKSNIESE